MSIYSQSKLPQALFLGGEYGRGQEKKLGSKLDLDFSKRSFITFSYTSLLGSNTNISQLLNWQVQMQFPAK
jgi:hypothetical protein